MNKYTYIYYYLKGILGDTSINYIFHNDEDDKFYEIEFDNLYDYLVENGHYHIDLKWGDEIELPSTHLRKIDNIFLKTYYRAIYKLLQVKNNPKLLNKGAFLAFALFLTLETPHLTNKYILPKVEEILEENQEKNKAMSGDFDSSIQSNITINSEIYATLTKDLNYLVSKISIYDKTSASIQKRIANYDFSQVNNENYHTCLAYLLFGEEGELPKLIASQLTSASNDLQLNEDGQLLGLISIEISREDLTRLMNKGTEEYQNILVNTLNIPSDEARELISNLQKYYCANDVSIKDNINKKLSEYIVRKYQNTSISTSFKEILLSSEIFNGKFCINHNIFADNIIVEVTDSKYGNYNLYLDEITKDDVSIDVYKEKLLKLLEEKGDNLDYNDADCRFLYYLYYLCFIDGYRSDYEQVLDIKGSKEVLTMMLDKVFGSDGFVSLNREFLYSYLSNGKARVNDLAYEVTYIDEYSLDVALFREYEMCLEKELEAGNINSDEYNNLIGRIEKWINNKLESRNVDLYNEYLRAINEDDHIFSEFSILGDYEYHEEKLKQYEYKVK